MPTACPLLFSGLWEHTEWDGCSEGSGSAKDHLAPLVSGLPSYPDKSDAKGRLWEGSSDSSSLQIVYSSPFKSKFPIHYSGQAFED